MKFQEPLSECENIILEAKRVLLNEQLDKIANITLSQDIFIQNSDVSDIIYTSNEWPSTISLTSVVQEKPPLHSQNLLANVELERDKELLKKYFNRWKIIKEKSPEQLQEEKLNHFIANLKTHQYEPPKPKSAPKPNKTSKNPKPMGCFKHRYKSQEHIIDMQRSKIEEQNKIIDELKLGIIREDLLKSIENTKTQIRDIFSDCSEKLLSQAPLVLAIDEREKIMISSQKAPKTIQKMQQRAVERAKCREIILERKKLLEEARQKLLEQAIEKKRALEEDERKRHLELINEQRKKELHLQKIRQEKKREFERKLSVATNFYKKLLIGQCFRKLLLHYLKSKENYTLATEYDLHQKKRWTFKAWLGHVVAKYKVKLDIAEAHFEFKALTKAFNKLKEFKLESVRSMQVAEDVYDFRLVSNTFIHWHRVVCKQIMLESKRMEIAIKHNHRRMLFQYFYFWRTLPVVIQLEKAKEEKKRKWRKKVWEILPDYQPPEQ